jgi:hypothetical protein
MSGCTDRCEAWIARNKAIYRQHHCSPRESTDDLMAAVGGGTHLRGAVPSWAELRYLREPQGLDLQGRDLQGWDLQGWDVGLELQYLGR